MKRVHKEKLHKMFTPQILAFVIPIIILLVLYLIREVYPFGERAYMRMDFYHQYAPFVKEFVDRLRSGESLLYAWESGLGTNYWAHYAYYLATPFNFLIALVPKEYVIEAMNFTMILRAGIAGFSMVTFLKEEQKENIMMAPFGIFYALSGYYIAYSCNIMWMDGFALFPLVALGVKRIAKGQSAKLYTITMLICTFSNFYMAVIAGMCCVVYLTVELIAGNKKTIKQVFASIVRFGSATLLYVACCGVILLPTALALRNTPAGDSVFPEKTEFYFAFYELLGRMSVNADPMLKGSEIPNIYASVMVIFCVLLYFFNKEIGRREKLAYGSAAVFLLASFEWNVLDYIWHGLHFPNSFPARQSFFYIFLVIVMAYKSYEKRKDLHKAAIPVALVIFLAAFGGYFFWLGKGEVNEKTTILIFTMIVGVIYAVILFGEKLVPYPVFLTLLLIICIGETSMNTLIVGLNSCVIRENYMEDDLATEALLAQIMPGGNEFYRIEELNRKTVNDSSWDNYYGASYFSSTMPGGVKEFYDAFGMRTSSVSHSYEGATPLTTSLLGVRYVFATEECLPANGFTETVLMTEEDSVILYENKWVLPIGFVMDGELEDRFEYDYSNPFKTQNRFAKAVLGTEEVLFTDMKKESEGDYKRFINVAAGENAFVYVTSYIDAIEMEVVHLETGERVTKEIDDIKFKKILSLGVAEYDRKIIISAAEEPEKKVSFYACTMNESVWKAVCRKLQEQPMDIREFSDGKIVASAEVSEHGILFTTIPYDAGWTVKVNGEKVETFAWKDAFLAFEIREGMQEITFSYVPQGFYEGLAVTVAGVILSILTIVWNSRKKKTLKKGNDLGIIICACFIKNMNLRRKGKELMRMKKASILIMVFLMALLCGCAKKSPEEISATTIYVNKDGSIEATFVEDFSQSYYDMTELQNMANEEIAAYNANAGEEKIILTFYEVSGNVAKLQMTFADAECYRDYNKEDVFVGTIAQALEAGYDLNVSLTNVENTEEVIGEHELLTMQDSNIVIVENAVRVRTQSKMQYMSTDAVFIDEYEVDGYDNPDATVIVY